MAIINGVEDMKTDDGMADDPNVIGRTCVKCGSTSIIVQYVGKSKYYYNEHYVMSQDEFLFITCKRCQYKWKEDTLDRCVR